MTNAERLDIINKVRTGELSIEEAARRLEFIEAPAGPAEEAPLRAVPMQAGQAAAPSGEDFPALDLGWWQYAWLIPLGVGIVIVILSAWLLSWGYINERMFWFYCSWLPLLLGLFVLTLGAWSRLARWAHVRIHSSDGTRIAVSVPLPARFAGWVLRLLAPRIPALRDKNLDVLPVLLDELGRSRDPIFVDVDDKDGDQVRVYIV